MAHLFSYGSLMWADILARVCGPEIPLDAAPQPATLADHVRRPVRGQDYPALVPATGQSVSGMLWKDLPDAIWPRLDAFEGETYERIEVLVTVADGSWQRAWAFAFKPGFVQQLGEGEWDEAAFAGEGKARFIARYIGFDAI